MRRMSLERHQYQLNLDKGVQEAQNEYLFHNS
jgi:hypothetical protein